jgi:hypothetical protein
MLLGSTNAISTCGTEELSDRGENGLKCSALDLFEMTEKFSIMYSKEYANRVRRQVTRSRFFYFTTHASVTQEAILSSIDFETPSATLSMYTTIWQLKPMIDDAALAKIDQLLQVANSTGS